jgi:hypothetical protein
MNPMYNTNGHHGQNHPEHRCHHQRRRQHPQQQQQEQQSKQKRRPRTWHRLVPMTDRKLMHILLIIPFYFGLNLLYMWEYHYRHFLPQQEQQQQLHPLNIGIGRSAHNDVDDDDDDDYESIFCRNDPLLLSWQQNNHTTTTMTMTMSRPNHPIFLWGIPSTTSDADVQRRRLIRSTYLNFYRDARVVAAYNNSKHNNNNNNNNNSNNNDNNTNSSILTISYHPDRICSLQEWTCQHQRYRDHCQIIYVFFIGGAAAAAAASMGNNTPTELLDESLTDFRQMLVNESPLKVPKFIPPPSKTTKNNSNNNKNNNNNNNNDNNTRIHYGQ